MQRLQAFKFELRPNSQQARRETPIPEATTTIGINMGIARFATMTDGSFITPLLRRLG
jgi:hypothetical protein